MASWNSDGNWDETKAFGGNPHSQKTHITTIRVVSGNEVYTSALIKEPPAYFSKSAIILSCACLIGFFCSTCNGFDGSLFNSLLEIDEFKAFFDVPDNGIWAGIVTSMYQIGSVVAIPFIGPSIDTWGRKVGMAIGAIFIILGTIIQGSTTANASVGQFMGGRFLLGFGVGIISSAGPMYVVEVSHPALRSVMTAMYNCFWFVGSIVASGTARGANNFPAGDQIRWILPVWLQLMFSGCVVIFVWFLPESPRWLYVNNQLDEATKMLIEYHGQSNPDSVWVRMQLKEYNECLELDGADKRWWDYRALFNNRAARIRLGCNIMVSIFGQFAGNSVISYFQDAVLNTAGIHDTTTKLNITLSVSCSSFIIALIGAACVDRVGRRPLLLFTNFSCACVWIGISVATGIYAYHGGDPDASVVVPADARPAGIAALVMIYIFGFVYSFGFTPLQALYPVEVLSFEMRAKGMAFSNFAVSAASLINQFALPVSLKEITWKTYIIFVVWDFFQTASIYFFIPETKNRTLEELDEIFAAKNPTKKSLTKRKMALDRDQNLIRVEDA